MKWLDPLRPYWLLIRTGLWLALVIGAALYGRGCGRAERAAEVETLKADHAIAIAASAVALAKLATDYRERERALGADFIAATETHHEELSRVQAERDSLVARLVAGTDRLQDRWAGCLSAAAQASGRAGAFDAAARDRAESAGRVVAAAAQCDAHVRALQSLLIAERAR